MLFHGADAAARLGTPIAGLGGDRRRSWPKIRRNVRDDQRGACSVDSSSGEPVRDDDSGGFARVSDGGDRGGERSSPDDCCNDNACDCGEGDFGEAARVIAAGGELLEDSDELTDAGGGEDAAERLPDDDGGEDEARSVGE